MPKYFVSKDGQLHSWSYDLALGTMVRSGVSGSVADESMRIAESLLNEHEIDIVYSVTWTLISEEIRRGNLSQASLLVESMKSGPLIGAAPRKSSTAGYFHYVMGLVRVIDLVRIIGAEGPTINKKLGEKNINHNQWIIDMMAADLGIDDSGMSLTPSFSFSRYGELTGEVKDQLTTMSDKWRSSDLGSSLKTMGIKWKDLVDKVIDKSSGTIDSATKTLFGLDITPFSREEARDAIGENPRSGGDPRLGADNDKKYPEKTVTETIIIWVGELWSNFDDDNDDDSNASSGFNGVRGMPHPDSTDETGKLWQNFVALAPLWKFNPNEPGQPMPFEDNTHAVSGDNRTIGRSSRLDRWINWGPDGNGLSTDRTGTPPVVDPGGRVPTPDPPRPD